MKTKVKISVIGFSVISVLGVLWHFAYGWLGEPAWTGLVFPINESIWEHLKLIFFPTVIWWWVEWFFIGRFARFFPIRVFALTLSVVSIPVLYYTYSGVIGRRFSPVDIGIFFIATALYFFFVSLFSKKERPDGEGETLGALIVFCVLLFSFWIFTFYPPSLAIFQNP